MRFLTSHAIRRSLTPLGLGLAAMLGCYKSGEGADPDDVRPYFPTGIALSPIALEADGVTPTPDPDDPEMDPTKRRKLGSRWLFLANSNFDLAYNAGTVQAYDAVAIRRALKACK